MRTHTTHARGKAKKKTWCGAKYKGIELVCKVGQPYVRCLEQKFVRMNVPAENKG